jgi:outer membrane protein TolC
VPPSSEAEKEALSKRTDVRVAQRRVQAAERVSHDSWTEFTPTLAASFQPFAQQPASLTNPVTGWQAFVVFALPFYDGGARYGRIQQRDALAAEANATLEQTVRQAKSDVRVSQTSLERAQRALAASRRAADLARTSLELAQLAYRTGAATNLELIDAQRRLRDAELNVAVAEDGVRQATLDLLAATGRFP